MGSCSNCSGGQRKIALAFRLYNETVCGDPKRRLSGAANP
jgi:hypothetical protein